MAKKKSKKKEDKKKEGKKKLLKLKLKKKKEKKKKEKKKKKPGKKLPLAKVQPEIRSTSAPKAAPNKPIAIKTDHSSNYNAKEAVKKLRTFKTKDELLSFTKGEKRLTVKKVIPAAMKRLK